MLNQALHDYINKKYFQITVKTMLAFVKKYFFN